MSKTHRTILTPIIQEPTYWRAVGTDNHFTRRGSHEHKTIQAVLRFG